MKKQTYIYKNGIIFIGIYIVDKSIISHELIILGLAFLCMGRRGRDENRKI